MKVHSFPVRSTPHLGWWSGVAELLCFMNIWKMFCYLWSQKDVNFEQFSFAILEVLQHRSISILILLWKGRFVLSVHFKKRECSHGRFCKGVQKSLGLLHYWTKLFIVMKLKAAIGSRKVLSIYRKNFFNLPYEKRWYLRCIYFGMRDLCGFKMFFVSNRFINKNI